MKQFLIYCRYTVYCQGEEEVWGYFLIYAETFKEASGKLIENVDNPKYIENRTF